MVSYLAICFDLPQCKRYNALTAACQDGKKDWFS
jgi:hypothetical protein